MLDPKEPPEEETITQQGFFPDNDGAEEVDDREIEYEIGGADE